MYCENIPNIIHIIGVVVTYMIVPSPGVLVVRDGVLVVGEGVDVPSDSS